MPRFDAKIDELLQQALLSISGLPPALRSRYAVTDAALRLQLSEVKSGSEQDRQDDLPGSTSRKFRAKAPKLKR